MSLEKRTSLDRRSLNFGYYLNNKGVAYSTAGNIVFLPQEHGSCVLSLEDLQSIFLDLTAMGLFTARTVPEESESEDAPLQTKPEP